MSEVESSREATVGPARLDQVSCDGRRPRFGSAVQGLGLSRWPLWLGPGVAQLTFAGFHSLVHPRLLDTQRGLI